MVYLFEISKKISLNINQYQRKYQFQRQHKKIKRQANVKTQGRKFTFKWIWSWSTLSILNIKCKVHIYINSAAEENFLKRIHRSNRGWNWSKIWNLFCVLYSTIKIIIDCCMIITYLLVIWPPSKLLENDRQTVSPTQCASM